MTQAELDIQHSLWRRNLTLQMPLEEWVAKALKHGERRGQSIHLDGITLTVADTVTLFNSRNYGEYLYLSSYEMVGIIKAVEEL